MNRKKAAVFDYDVSYLSVTPASQNKSPRPRPRSRSQDAGGSRSGYVQPKWQFSDRLAYAGVIQTMQACLAPTEDARITIKDFIGCAPPPFTHPEEASLAPREPTQLCPTSRRCMQRELEQI